jgi:HTH-type transcriptional regulator / antitoxin HipB
MIVDGDHRRVGEANPNLANVTNGSSMLLRAPIDIGCAIRDRRSKLGLDQQELARRVGVSRKWIVEVEKGKPRAEIGLVLRTFTALGLKLSFDDGSRVADKVMPDPVVPYIDIDQVLEKLRRK